MKRPSYSIHRCTSALYGSALIMRDRLHASLVTLADTTPGVVDYRVYSPRFVYESGGAQREGSFPVAVKFDDNRVELWASSWSQECNEGSPVERARRLHSESLGATYQRFTPGALEANRILVKNRQTMQGVLFRGFRLDTGELEANILALLHGGAHRINTLAARCKAHELHIQLAVFRLLRKRRAQGQLETAFISPDWEVSHA